MRTWVGGLLESKRRCVGGIVVAVVGELYGGWKDTLVLCFQCTCIHTEYVMESVIGMERRVVVD